MINGIIRGGGTIIDFFLDVAKGEGLRPAVFTLYASCLSCPAANTCVVYKIRACKAYYLSVNIIRGGLATSGQIKCSGSTSTRPAKIPKPFECFSRFLNCSQALFCAGEVSELHAQVLLKRLDHHGSP
jgi:hypothetical protein